MKSLQHARSSAHRHGGAWPDYEPLHAWFDATKGCYASMQHRFVLHSDWGCLVARRAFGEALPLTGGGAAATALVAEDHQIEDVGAVVPLGDWLAEIGPGDLRALEAGRDRAIAHPRARALARLRDDPVAGLVARHGGMPADYRPIVDFFDWPSAHLGGDPRGLWVLHHAFGPFLAEGLFGRVLALGDGKLLNTRTVGEDLILARVGALPPLGAIAGRIRLRPWMRGAEVYAGLRRRKADARTLAILGVTPATVDTDRGDAAGAA